MFGETPGGQKACLHLHRAFPYFYVPYDDDLPRDPVECGTFLKNLGQSLERARSWRCRAAMLGSGGRGRGRAQHAAGDQPRHKWGEPLRRIGIAVKNEEVRFHDATLVRAKPFYGYHSGERLFIKLRLYDPSTVQRAAAAMLSGGILNRIFQPHESHVPYLLQVKVDHNLHGMGLAS